MSDLSTAEALALVKNGDSMGGSWWFILLIIFFLFMFMKGGNSSTQEALTRAELFDGLNVQDVKSSIGDLSTQMNGGFSTIQQTLCNGFGVVNQNISNLGHAMEMCCCQTKEAVHAEGELTRGLINQIEQNTLRSQLDDKNRELLHANLIASQLSQTNNIQNFIRSAMSGCGCGCGYTA